MSEAAPHLVVRSVSKRYGPTTVLDHIDLTIRRGELVTLLGPSGCGKTTLLRAIAGLAQPMPARSNSRGATSPTCRRTSVTSAWCSRATRCFRT